MASKTTLGDRLAKSWSRFKAKQDLRTERYKSKGLRDLVRNSIAIGDNLWHSFRRRTKATSSRSRSEAIFQNLFLHFQNTTVHKHSLRITYTFGFGVALGWLFLILIITGILLLVYYVPSIEGAFNSVKDIEHMVPFGHWIRNFHRWSGDLMVIIVFLHMIRVFYTASYTPPREFNWIIGIVLLMLVFFLNLTGYFLPWDQLGYWAIDIVANIVRSPREVTDGLGITQWFDLGGFMKEKIFLGEETPRNTAIVRLYAYHCFLVPFIVLILIGVHFWRISKDGGLSKPKEVENEDDKVFVRTPSKSYGLMAVVKGKKPTTGVKLTNLLPSWPYLIIAEVAVLMVVLALLFVLTTVMEIPLREPATMALPENPAKAPWYFLGLQELLSYSAFTGGVFLPFAAMFFVALLPYFDREEKWTGKWFSGKDGIIVTIVSLVFATALTLFMLWVVVTFGWFRNWWPHIPQLWITAINPGTIICGIVLVYSVVFTKLYNSTRMGAIAFFTCFVVCLVILTYFGIELRGPDWQFYWSRAVWPVH